MSRRTVVVTLAVVVALVVAALTWGWLAHRPPSRDALVALVQQGDPTLSATDAGCVVDALLGTVDARRAEQILDGRAGDLTSAEDDAVVTSGVTCTGATGIDLTRRDADP